jgi:hypothetical protein
MAHPCVYIIYLIYTYLYTYLQATIPPTPRVRLYYPLVSMRKRPETAYQVPKMTLSTYLLSHLRNLEMEVRASYLCCILFNRGYSRQPLKQFLMSTLLFQSVITFTSPVGIENGYSKKRVSDGTQSSIEIRIYTDGIGAFDWEMPEIETYESGGLEFDGKKLIWFDGLLTLPAPMVDTLEAAGYNMDYAKY